MPPTKTTKPLGIKPAMTKTTSLRYGITTRSQKENCPLDKKRKAQSPIENGILKREKGLTRAVLGDVTVNKMQVTAKKTTVQAKVLPSIQKPKLLHKSTAKPVQDENQPSKMGSLANYASSKTTTASKTTVYKDTKLKTLARPALGLFAKKEAIKKTTKTRLSTASSTSSEDSLYVTAVEEINDHLTKGTVSKLNKLQISTPPVTEEPPQIPPGVVDIDKETWNDIYLLSRFAMDMFSDLKEQEKKFVTRGYMHKHKHITAHMRSLLVDWMVEVQENFELNHETLYLSVKLVDVFLSKVEIEKDSLQLVGAAAMLLACKYDERMPPLLDDFIFICDGAYVRDQLVSMEKKLLRVVNFNMSFPLSYSFLRRFGRCAKVNMPVLTLARFILELSLMDYTTVVHLESKLAAAALYIALRMDNISDWTPTLEYYTGYKLKDFTQEVKILNDYLHEPPQKALNTIRNKYMHDVFFEVAKKPLIDL